MIAELRRTGIGGTDVAAICGLDSRRGRFSVWCEKHGLYEGPPVTWRMRLGKIFERTVIEDLYPELTGRPAKYSDETVEAPRFPSFGRVTPDGFCLGETRGVECKLVSWDQRHEWLDGNIPVRHELQMRYYMAAFGFPVWDIVSVHGMEDPRVATIERDMELEAAILDTVEEFWRRYVVGDERPPMDSTEAAGEYLRRQFPRGDNPLRPATDSEVVLLEEYAQARSEEREAATERKRLEHELKLTVRDCEGIACPYGRFTWRNAKESDKTDWEGMAKRFMAEYPEDLRNRIISEFTTKRGGERRIHFAWQTGEDDE